MGNRDGKESVAHMNAQQNKEIECLYLQMYNMLFEYAKSLLPDEEAAEEAVQEVFRIACQKPEAVCACPNPQGWTVQTLKYVLLNMERNRQAINRTLAKYTAFSEDDTMALPNQMEIELLYNDIAESDEYRLLKEMTFEGATYAEMAQRRGITVEACRKRMQRAKSYLRRRIKL